MSRMEVTRYDDLVERNLFLRSAVHLEVSAFAGCTKGHVLGLPEGSHQGLTVLPSSLQRLLQCSPVRLGLDAALALHP